MGGRMTKDQWWEKAKVVAYWGGGVLAALAALIQVMEWRSTPAQSLKAEVYSGAYRQPIALERAISEILVLAEEENIENRMSIDEFIAKSFANERSALFIVEGLEVQMMYALRQCEMNESASPSEQRGAQSDSGPVAKHATTVEGLSSECEETIRGALSEATNVLKEEREEWRNCAKDILNDYVVLETGLLLREIAHNLERLPQRDATQYTLLIVENDGSRALEGVTVRSEIRPLLAQIERDDGVSTIAENPVLISIGTMRPKEIVRIYYLSSFPANDRSTGLLLTHSNGTGEIVRYVPMGPFWQTVDRMTMPILLVLGLISFVWATLFLSSRSEKRVRDSRSESGAGERAAQGRSDDRQGR